MLRLLCFILGKLLLEEHWLKNTVVGRFLILILSFFQVGFRVALIENLLTFLISILLSSVGHLMLIAYSFLEWMGAVAIS